VPSKQSVPGSGMLARIVVCLIMPAFELNCAVWGLRAIGAEFPALGGTACLPVPGSSELLSANAAMDKVSANIGITKNRFKCKPSGMFDIDRCFDADLAASLPRGNPDCSIKRLKTVNSASARPHAVPQNTLQINGLVVLSVALSELACKAMHTPAELSGTVRDGQLVPGDGTNVGFTGPGWGGIFEVSSFRGRAVRASCDPQGLQDAS